MQLFFEWDYRILRICIEERSCILYGCPILLDLLFLLSIWGITIELIISNDWWYVKVDFDIHKTCCFFRSICFINKTMRIIIIEDLLFARRCRTDYKCILLNQRRILNFIFFSFFLLETLCVFTYNLQEIIHFYIHLHKTKIVFYKN